MQRTLLPSAFLFFGIGAFAQLAPQQQAPLFAHMNEVNAQWRNHPTIVDGEQLVSFANEAERIATHLHLVQAHLATCAHEGLSVAQAANRHQRLAELQRYADRGRFPQNHVLSFRNPIFIDPDHTACAVGQLIIESGNEALAERISAAMNNTYIKDMHWPEINAWADAQGFDRNELAWIQPGYPPAYNWFALGDGTNGDVSELLTLSNGDLILAGTFTEAGGGTANRVARYTGGYYAALPGLPDGVINASIEFDGNIYLGGTFNNGSTDLAMWNGSAWTTGSVFSSKFGEVTALHVHDGALYAAGASSGFAGISYDVRRKNGDVWDNVGQTLNNSIHTIATVEGELVCGGDFTGNFLAVNEDIAHVARLSANVWEQLGDGLNGGVRDLVLQGTTLYAGGDLLLEMESYFGLARIAVGANQWEPLMPNLTNYIFSPLDAPARILAMQAREGKIYLAGDMFIAQGMVQGQGLAVFNGTADAVEPMCDFFGPVHDMALLNNNQLVIGGASVPWTNIASLDLSTGIVDGPTTLTFTVTPNPAVNEITVRLPLALGANTRVRILDAAGRTVAITAQRAGDLLRFNTQALAAGNYQIEATDAKAKAIGRFIKE